MSKLEIEKLSNELNLDTQTVLEYYIDHLLNNITVFLKIQFTSRKLLW